MLVKRKDVARLMSKHIGYKIDPDLVVMLPDDGTPGSIGSGHWDVYAARAGEFAILVYAFDSGEIKVTTV